MSHYSYGFDVDFPLSSSVILVITVGLWIFWVAPHFLRHRLQYQGAAVEPAAEMFSAVSSDVQAGTVMTMTTQQETVMDNRKSGPAVAGEPASRREGAFRIRYGRCAIALVGLLALVTAMVTVLLLPFGIVSGPVPAAAALITVTSVVLLRTMAVRSRRAKVQRAFRYAMEAGTAASAAGVPQKPLAAPGSAVLHPPKQTADPFNAESGEHAAQPFTSAELRAAALAVATDSGDTAVRSSPSGTPWQPVELPRPVYVDAAKAERPAPEPLELPEAPKPSVRTPLKQPAAPSGDSTASAAKSHCSLTNLDDVLQRRRA